MESWIIGQSKISNKTKMEKSWKAGHPGGEKRRGERGKRRGGTTGRSRVRSKRREKVRRTLLNKSSYNINIVNRSIDLLTCQIFLLKIIQHFSINFRIWKSWTIGNYPTPPSSYPELQRRDSIC